MTPRIAFLDRDGVLNEDHGYVSKPTDWTWIDGAPAAIRLLNEAGFKVVIVTNQSGIGRGFYSEQQFHQLMTWVDQQLAGHGARIDATYFCPHHPEQAQDRYRTHCRCRKPAPGMLLDALRDFGADAADCVLIGDSPRDVEAARAAGVRGWLFDGDQPLDALVRERVLAASQGPQ